MAEKKPPLKYTLKMFNGDQRFVMVPAGWKVTFGPLIPHSNGVATGDGIGNTLCFRLYEGKEARACFPDIASFTCEGVESEVKMSPERIANALASKPSESGAVRRSGRPFSQVTHIRPGMWPQPDDTEGLDTRPPQEDPDVAF